MSSYFVEIKQGLDPRRSYLIVEGSASSISAENLSEFMNVLSLFNRGIRQWESYKEEEDIMLIGELEVEVKEQLLQNLLGVDLPNGMRIYVYDPCFEQ